jgi:hypothetical protein
MEAYQQRIVDEKQDLDEGMSRLARFMNSSYFGLNTPAEQDRITKQYEAMTALSKIMGERISNDFK